jgi:hypothetical protein
MAQAFYRVPFQIDHIIAKQHGGETVLENLAWSCFHCNTFKGPNIGGIDPEGGRLTRLYHLRLDHWEEHFSWSGVTLTGLSAVGRATIAVLKINDPDYVAVRQALLNEGVFP